MAAADDPAGTLDVPRVYHPPDCFWSAMLNKVATDVKLTVTLIVNCFVLIRIVISVEHVVCLVNRSATKEMFSRRTVSF